MFRKLIILFCIISLLGIIAEITVRCSVNLSEKVSSGIFSFNKNTETVEAKVLGCTYKFYRNNKSSTRVSHFYAVSYSFQGERYFSQLQTADYANGDYKGCLYLPENINILIDADSPRNGIYPQNYHPMSANFWLVHLLFSGLLILTLFSVEDTSVRQQTLRWKNSKGFKKKYEFVFLRLMIFAPLLITIYNASYYAASAKGNSITNYQLMLITNAAEKEQESMPEAVEYVRGEFLPIFRDIRPLIWIDKFPLGTLTDCYAVTDDGEKVQMDFYFNVRQLYVKNTPDNERLKYLILQTKDATYFVPLETIHFR